MPMLARDLMQADPVTVTVETPFLQVQHLFVVTQISGVPVVDARGTVVGIISATDLLRAVDQACDDDLDDEPSPPGVEELPERLGALTARDVASPDLIWVAPDTPIAQVAHRMRTEGIHRVLVGSDQRLAGILTTFDLLAAIEG